MLLIVVDATSVPDFPSGVRTRLRGLYGAYGRRHAAPPVVLLVAPGSLLFDGVELGAVQVAEVPSAGGPWARALFRGAAGFRGALVRSGFRTREGQQHSWDAVRAWHAETIPPLGPRGVPSLLTLHDARFLAGAAASGRRGLSYQARHQAWRLWLPRVLRATRALVTVSEAVAGDLRQAFPQVAARIHTVANAMVDGCWRQATPAEVESCVQEHGLSRPFFLCVGHLDRRKGLDLLFEVLERCGPRSPLVGADLVLVGRGREEARWRRRARRLPRPEQVRFLGRPGDATVAALQGGARALLFPSHVEGFGFPVFEALQRGCPVLATPLPPLREVECRGLERLPRETQRWQSGMERCLGEPVVTRVPFSVRTTRGEATTWELSAEAMAELYDSVSSADPEDSSALARE